MSSARDFLNPFLKYLMQNDIEEKEQYLNELLKYDQMNNKLALLLKKAGECVVGIEKV